VTFEKESASKTALLLDNTQLGPAQVHVTAAKSLDELSGGKATSAEGEHTGEHDIPQEDKPRSRVLAEYLAHGYVISDKAIERALALDKQHGISSRFTSTLQAFDQKFKATERANAADQKLGVSARAMTAWGGLNSYFDKAINTPTGQRLRKFYEDGNKQVIDVHNEARHLADLKAGKSSVASPEKVEGSERTKCNCGADDGKCGCAPGTCACSSCSKNPEADASHGKVGVEEAGMHAVEGKEGRTECNCGSTTEKCPCEPGKCGM
jgi:hypothetical protein